jgi:Ca2+:H+ antiporter
MDKLMLDRVFLWLLLLTPAAIAAYFLDSSPLLTFFIAALAIIPLAKFLGEATEELASHSGPAVGGLLNATFGNASLTGSIIGNLLLVLGMSMLVGGLKHRKQTFNRTGTMASATMLFLAAIALLIPAFLSNNQHEVTKLTTQHLSNVIAAVMLIIYFANMAFVFITHKHLYTEEVGKYEPEWSVKKSLLVMLSSTVAIGFVSEILVKAIEPALATLGWTELFMGTIVIAIIGNAAEHFSAIVMAYKNRMDLSMQIAAGSAIQVAMLVVPLLVFVSIFMGHSMNLVFTNFELLSIVLSIMICNLVIQDGESNWLEGAQLLSAYGIIAVAFFLHP